LTNIDFADSHLDWIERFINLINSQIIASHTFSEYFAIYWKLDFTYPSEFSNSYFSSLITFDKRLPSDSNSPYIYLSNSQIIDGVPQWIRKGLIGISNNADKF